MKLKDRVRKIGRYSTATLAAGALLLAGCTAGSQTGGGDDSAILSIASPSTITTWDPVESFSDEVTYLANIYEPLLYKNPEGAAEEFTPALAESWETSEDGLSWTFHIREGVTFHDGESLNAEAVKLSIEAAADHGGASFIWAPLKEIEVTDEYTVVFHLEYPAPIDLIAAATYGAWIVSPKALEESANDDQYYDEGRSVGTGPYMVDSYTPGEEIVLVENPDYWNTEKAPYYSTVNIAMTGDSVTAQQMLTSGEVDYVTSLAKENVENIAETIGGEVVTANSPNNYLAYFNTKRPPLDDPKVRQALSYAIPYEDIIEVGAYGYGTQAHGPVPKGVFPYSENTPQYTYDLEKAQALLEEAGVEEGLELTLSYASDNAAETRFVPLIKDSFAKVGIDLTVTGEAFNQQWEVGKGDPMAAQDIFVVLYWPTYGDAGADNLNAMFRYTEETSFNLSYWHNPEYEGLLDEAGKLTGVDREAAQAKYEEAMEILLDQAPAAFLYDDQSVRVVPAELTLEPYNENYPAVTFFATIRPAE